MKNWSLFVLQYLFMKNWSLFVLQYLFMKNCSKNLIIISWQVYNTKPDFSPTPICKACITEGGGPHSSPSLDKCMNCTGPRLYPIDLYQTWRFRIKLQGLLTKDAKTDRKVFCTKKRFYKLAVGSGSKFWLNLKLSSSFVHIMFFTALQMYRTVYANYCKGSESLNPPWWQMVRTL